MKKSRTNTQLVRRYTDAFNKQYRPKGATTISYLWESSNGDISVEYRTKLSYRPVLSETVSIHIKNEDFESFRQNANLFEFLKG